MKKKIKSKEYETIEIENLEVNGYILINQGDGFIVLDNKVVPLFISILKGFLKTNKIKPINN